MDLSLNSSCLNSDEKGEPTLELNDKGGYFDLAPTDLGENCRRDIVLELEEMGFEIEASHHEVAPGQHEIDLRSAGAIRSCDDIQTFKLVVKTIARKHGLHATFMPKPLFGVNVGMHCNLSALLKIALTRSLIKTLIFSCVKQQNISLPVS